jgi:hypothetical protein
MTKAEFAEELDAVKMVAEEALETACAKQLFHPLGHAFLWCNSIINGKCVRFLVGSIDGRENIAVIEHEVTNAVKEISSVYVNMD